MKNNRASGAFLPEYFESPNGSSFGSLETFGVAHPTIIKIKKHLWSDAQATRGRISSSSTKHIKRHIAFLEQFHDKGQKSRFMDEKLSVWRKTLSW